MTFTSGLRPPSVCFALSTFGMPMRSSAWMICRCRLDTSTTSSSMMPSVPTPAAARYSAPGAPRAPRPGDRRARFDPFNLPRLAHLGQHRVARIADLLVLGHHVRQVERVAGALPRAEPARQALHPRVPQLL